MVDLVILKLEILRELHHDYCMIYGISHPDCYCGQPIDFLFEDRKNISEGNQQKANELEKKLA